MSEQSKRLKELKKGTPAQRLAEIISSSSSEEEVDSDQRPIVERIMQVFEITTDEPESRSSKM